MTVATRPAGPGLHDRGAAGPRHADVGVLSLALDPWSWQWNSRHQVLTRLARHFRVVWLEPPVEWRSAIRHALRGARERTPPGMPPGFVVRRSADWMPLVYRPARLAQALLRARLAAAHESLRRAGCRRVVLYIWHPSVAAALQVVPHDVSCYHIYDEYFERQADPAEERLIRAVDRVFMVSPPMFARKGALNPHSLLLSNGVDYEAFATAAPLPADLAAVPRPWIGYAGFIKTQLDFDLIESLAARHPDWSFVLVGGRRVQPGLDALVARLERLRNVHLLGARTTAELARYPQHFDVCLMPYRDTAYSASTYPLKLNEYLAAGRPIVTIPLPALPQGSGLVRVARGVAEWEEALETALQPAADAAPLVAARRAEARRHDWSAIVDRIAGEITDALGARLPAG